MTSLNRRLRKRHRYTRAERRRIFESDRVPFTRRAKCRYGWHTVHEDDEWRVAHEIPWSKWGPNARWNVGVSCPECNQAAGDETMTVLQSISLRTWTILVTALLAVALYLALTSFFTSPPR